MAVTPDLPPSSDTQRKRWPRIAGGAFVFATTFSYLLAHWRSRTIAELAKDAFELLTQPWIPVPLLVQERMLFALLGFALSMSLVAILRRMPSLPFVGRRFAIVFGDLRLLFVFVVSAYISWQIFCEALRD